jgi:recombination protein RecR
MTIESLVSVLSRLPGVGKRSAERLAYFLLSNKDEARLVSSVISEVIDSVRFCSLCGNFTQVDPCSICSDLSRDNTVLCVVEDPRDMTAIEGTGLFKGLYHILMGSINPLEGIGPDKLRIAELQQRVSCGSFTEVLLATNPTVDGEATFLYTSDLLKNSKLRISRLATGIPMGASLEFTDSLTLKKALEQKLYL